MRAIFVVLFLLFVTPLYAVSPVIFGVHQGPDARRLPESPVGFWRARLMKFRGRSLQAGRVAPEWLFAMPMSWTADYGPEVGDTVREPTFFPRQGTDYNTGWGVGRQVEGQLLRIFQRTPSGSLLPNTNLSMRVDMGAAVGDLIYDVAASSATLMVFRTPYATLGGSPDEMVVYVEPLTSSPFEAGSGGGESAWTETRVSQYMQWYSDYVLPAMNDIHDHLPDIAENLNDMKEMLDDAVSPGANYYEVLLKALYPSGGAPFDGSETSYLQTIAESLSADGTFADGALTPETADFYPGNLETSPLNTRVKPMFNDSYGWLHGPTMPTEASSRDPHPLGTTGRVQTGFKYRIDLGQFWPSAAGNRMRDVELDLSAFDTVRTLVHVVMSGLFGLFACHRIWDEFRRQ